MAKPKFISLLLLSLSVIASAEVFFEERFEDGINIFRYKISVDKKLSLKCKAKRLTYMIMEAPLRLSEGQRCLVARFKSRWLWRMKLIITMLTAFLCTSNWRVVTLASVFDAKLQNFAIFCKHVS